MQHFLHPHDVVTEIHQSPMTMPNKKMMSEAMPAIDEALWQKIATTPVADHSLVYIHIPFCMNHCVFCGFYKNLWKEERGTPYVDRLIAEMAYEAEIRPKGGTINAVYFGGGTPTALSAKDLSRLILAAKKYLPLSDDCEITVEGRMSHFTTEKIEAALKAGANRFSIGVQTFNTELRQKLGRHHSGEDAFEYMQKLSSYQEAAVVLDLIYGLPSQTDEIWQNDITTVLEIGLDGLDIYAFKCFPFLPIKRMIEKNTFAMIDDSALPMRHYAYAVNRLKDAGLTQISNSHFAANVKERNIYNEQLKWGTPYLAFGSGAGGYHAGIMYAGEGDLNTYLNTPLDQKPLAFAQAVSPRKSHSDKIKGGIEVGFIDQSLFAHNEATKALLATWHQQKLLASLDANKIALTTAGRYWGTAITRTLLQTL